MVSLVLCCVLFLGWSKFLLVRLIERVCFFRLFEWLVAEKASEFHPGLRWQSFLLFMDAFWFFSHSKRCTQSAKCFGFFFEKCTLALFETRCTFLSFSFIKCWDVYKRKNFGKIKHRLFHGRVGRGVGSILDLTSQTTLYACLQSLDVMQINLWRQIGNRPIPVLTRSWDKWW